MQTDSVHQRETRSSDGVWVKVQPAGLFALICLPVLVAAAILYRTALGLPMLDDYPAILLYLLGFPHGGSKLAEVVYMLTAQCGDYKLIFEHLVVSSQVAVSHHVSFGLLVTLGDLFLLPTAAILYAGFFQEEEDLRSRLALFLPVSLLMFSLNYAETVNWAMGSLQNLPAIAFGLASILLLSQGTSYRFCGACVCAALACASSANGFLLAPVGLAMMVARGRAFGRMLAWSLTFAVMLAVYLFHYVRLEDLSPAPFWKKGLFFFGFLGSAVENMHGQPVRHAGVALGLGMFLVFCYALWIRWDRTRPFAFFSGVWILLCAALVAEVRVGLGLQVSLSGRYKIYSDLLLIFCYVLAVDWVRSMGFSRRRRRLCYGAAVSAAVLFCIAADVAGFRKLRERQALTVMGMRRYEEAPSVHSPVLDHPPVKGELEPQDPWDARTLLTEAIHNEIYVRPTE